jgi:hypothetical protein
LIPVPVTVATEAKATMIFLGVVLGWLGVGGVIAGAVVVDHFRCSGRFPRSADWPWIPTAAIVWPWPAWIWYQNTTLSQTVRIGLMAIVSVAAVGSGWILGSNFYDFLYPKAYPPDTAGLNVMIESLVIPETTGNIGTKIEQELYRRYSLKPASR